MHFPELSLCSGSKNRLVRELRISMKALYNKLRLYGIATADRRTLLEFQAARPSPPTIMP